MSDPLQSDLALHPGESLAEELEVREWTPEILAEAIGRPVALIKAILKGKRSVTAEIALDLESVLGTPAYFWVTKQARYDLVMARQKQRKSA